MVMTQTDDQQVNGCRLRELREARGWDAAELARLSSLSESQVIELENGGMKRFYSARIKTNAARKVAQVLAVAESELVSEPAEAVSPAHGEISGTVEPVRSWPVPAPARSSWVGHAVLSLVFLGVVAVWFFQTHGTASEPMSLVAPQAAVARAPAATAPTSAEPVALPKGESQVQTPAADSCASEGDPVVLQADHPNKPADKISLMLRTEATLCVQDSTGQVWREDLKPWLGRNYLGTAPWTLSSKALYGADVYFQGEKMRIASDKVHTITLQGKEVGF